MKKLGRSFIDYFDLRYKCGTFVAAHKLSLEQGTISHVFVCSKGVSV